MKTRYFSLLAALALLTSVQARAQNEPIGTVVAVEGSATLTHGGTSSPAAKNMKIYENDVVETGKKSRICVMFVDNTGFILGQDATLSIDEYVFDPANAKNNKGRFSSMRGAFEYASGLLDKNKDPDVKIQTSFGSIGIRGTQILAGDDNGQFGVFDQSGKINVDNNNGDVDLVPGDGTDLSGEKPPSPPEHWSNERIKHLHDQIDFHDQGAVDKAINKIKSRHKPPKPHHEEKPPEDDHADDVRDGSTHDIGGPSDFDFGGGGGRGGGFSGG
jgi:hypothetical protein